MQMTPNQNKPAQLDGSLTLSFVLHIHRISADGLNAGAKSSFLRYATTSQSTSDNLNVSSDITQSLHRPRQIASQALLRPRSRALSKNDISSVLLRTSLKSLYKYKFKRFRYS